MPNMQTSGANYDSFTWPTQKEWGLIGGALAVSLVLYLCGGKPIGEFAVKLADCLLQGAILTILFATLAKGLGVMLIKSAGASPAAQPNVPLTTGSADGKK